MIRASEQMVRIAERGTSKTAFINIPYAQAYEDRLMATIASLALFGLVPTAAIAAGSESNRLDRILTALSDSALSVHDLTWMTVDTTEPATPRSNMPFELGIAVAFSQVRGNHYMVMDTIPYRLDKALSDLRGVDPEVFDGTPEGVFRAISNVLYRDEFQPSTEHFKRLFQELRGRAATLKAEHGFVSIFSPRPFNELRLLAAEIANQFRRSSETLTITSDKKQPS